MLQGSDWTLCSLRERGGGLIINTHIVENYPGVLPLPGMELAEKMEKQVKELGVEIIDGEAKEARRGTNGFEVDVEGKTVEGKTLIFATGSKRRKLNAPGEEKFLNKGVSYCATCDGPLFGGKVVGVVGGSNSACKEALLLSQYASKAYIIYRKEKLRPEPITLKKIEESKNIEVIANASVVEIRGDRMLKEVVLDREVNGSRVLKLDGLFIEVGLVPESGLAKSLGVKCNDNGEVVVNEAGETSILGVFAAGDVTTSPFKQAIIAAAQGVLASYSAYRYLEQA